MSGGRGVDEVLPPLTDNRHWLFVSENKTAWCYFNTYRAHFICAHVPGGGEAGWFVPVSS